jgi:uncharacterized protein (DUF4415 family)
MKSTDDDFELQEEYDFSKGTRGRFYKPKKISTTIRLDDDILMFFKKTATLKKVPYQTMLNDVLRNYVASQIHKDG